MLRIQFFPSEIISNIIQMLPRQDMLQCMLINKKFYEIAVCKFYSSLILKSKNVFGFRTYFVIKGAKYETRHRKYYSLIESVDFSDPNLHYEIDCNKFFSFTLKMIDKLTYIDISGKQGYDTLMYMFDNVKENQLPHLQQIKIFDKKYFAQVYISQQAKKFYLSLCYRFRKSLTHLTLFDPVGNYALRNVEDSQIHLDLLPCFTRLTHLTVHFHTDNINMDLLLGPTLRVCPRLSHFRAFADNLLSSTFNNTFNERQFEDRIENVKPVESQYSGRPHNLKNVTLSMLTMSTVYMESIISKIPTSQLDEFKLLFPCESNIYRWVKQTDDEILKRFLQHLKLAYKSTIGTSHSSFSEFSKVTPSEEFYFIRRLWEVSKTLTTISTHKEYYEIVAEIKLMSYTPENHLNFDLKLNDKTLYVTQKISDEKFFSFKYLKISLKPFYDTIFGQDIDEMILKIEINQLEYNTNYLVRHYSHLKSLKIVTLMGGKKFKLLFRRKTIDDISNRVRRENLLVNNYMPIEIEVHADVLFRGTIRLVVANFPIIESLKITDLTPHVWNPILLLKLDNYISRLIMDFTFLPLDYDPVFLIFIFKIALQKKMLQVNFQTDGWRDFYKLRKEITKEEDYFRKHRMDINLYDCDELTIRSNGSVLYKNKLSFL